MKTLLAVLAAAVCAVAAPAHAQRVADLAPGAASYVQPTAAAPILAAGIGLAPALRPAAVQAPDAASQRRLSVVGHTAVGAGAGALAGVLASAALFVFDENCTSGDSMCGLAIPVFVGGGVLTGSVAGLVVGLVRNH